MKDHFVYKKLATLAATPNNIDFYLFLLASQYIPPTAVPINDESIILYGMDV